MKYYAVQQGHAPGIYLTWSDCEAQVKGYPGAKFKSFRSREEAEAFVKGQNPAGPASPGVDSRDSQPELEIWVDGSCLTRADGRHQLGWAYLIVQEGKEIHQASGNDIPREAHTHRNVAGEIMAVLKAIAWCEEQGVASARIYYDYQGLECWADGSWKTNTPFTEAYAKTVQSSKLALTWQKVLAHSGDPNNERVDRLAKAAAQNTK